MIFKRTRPKKVRQEIRVGLRTQLCKECRDFETRLCEVDGETCVFHRFVEERKALLKINVFCREAEIDGLLRRFKETGVVVPGCDTDIVRVTYALVEHPDGRLSKVDPENVRFIDRRVEEAAQITTRGAADK